MCQQAITLPGRAYLVDAPPRCGDALGRGRRGRRFGNDAPGVDAHGGGAAGERARTMADDDDRATPLQPLERLDDRGLGLLVDGARRLIEDEHGAVLQKGACQRDPLPLAAGQLHSAVADFRVVTLGQSLDELVGVGGLGSRNDLLARRPGRGVGDVLRDARREEHCLLEHDRELSAQVGEPVVAQVHTVQEDCARGRVVEAREQADQRGLPRARRPNDAEPRPRRDDAGDVVQHGPVGPVPERHPAELERAARPLEGAGVGPLGNFGLLIEQRERPLGAREVGLQRRRLLADRLQGLVQLPQVGHCHQELAEGQEVRLHVVHADEQHRTGAKRRREPDEQPVASFRQRHADACRHAFARALGEPLGLSLLPTEHLHDAEGAQRFLDDRECGALELLDVALLAPHTWAIQARQAEQRWRHGQRHERQLPVQPGRDHDHGAQCDRCSDEGDDSLDHDLVDHRRVLLNAIQRIGRALGIVVRQG